MSVCMFARSGGLSSPESVRGAVRRNRLRPGGLCWLILTLRDRELLPELMEQVQAAAAARASVTDSIFQPLFIPLQQRRLLRLAGHTRSRM
jgi:hypothetical protein